MPPHAPPSIKGVLVQIAVEAVKQLLADGRLRREDVEARLQAADLEMLDQKVLPGMWYPLDRLGNLLEVAVCAERERGGMDAVVQVGMRAAERLFASEIYANFVSTAESWGPRAGPTLVRLAPLLCNFTRWSFRARPSPGADFAIEVEEARQFPEVLRFVAQGFIQHLAERVGAAPVRVSSERTAPDRIVYTGVRAAA